MPDAPYLGLYNEPNVPVLYAMTEIVDSNLAQVTVHRSGDIHVTALGETIEQMHTNAATCYQTLREAGFPVKRATGIAAHLVYLPPSRQKDLM